MFDDIGPGTCVTIGDFLNNIPGTSTSGYVGNGFYALPYAFTGLRPPGEPGWGKAHKKYQRMFFKKATRVYGPVQEMPVFSARIQVDHTC